MDRFYDSEENVPAGISVEAVVSQASEERLVLKL